MEKLVWDIAVILGAEDDFVATGETEIRDKTQQSGGTQTAVQWDENGNLQKLINLKPSLKGGIQVGQKGKTFDNLNEDDIKLLSRDEIFNGILTSFLFGMFDAHSSNVFVTNEGKIKFFDNARSLPNSNEFIDRGRNMAMPYCCCLLELPTARTKLTLDEISKLKGSVKKYKNKMSELEKYLHSKEVQAQLRKLPVGWMDLDSSLNAMKERVSLMEKALEGNSVHTIEDLVCQSSPSYKFAFALTYLELLYIPIKRLESIHKYVKFISIKNINEKSKKIGINLNTIKTWSHDCTLEELTKKVTDYYNHVESAPPTNQERAMLNRENDEIEQQIFSNAVVDYKDFCRIECESYVKDKNLNLLLLNGVKIKSKSVDEGLSYAHKKGCKTLFIGNKDECRIIQATPAGYCVKELDLSFKPGMIREKAIDSSGKVAFAPEMKINDYLKSLENPPLKENAPLKFEDLSILTEARKEELTINRGLVASKTPDGHLVISIRERAATGFYVETVDFAPGSHGTFLVYPSELLGVQMQSYLTVDQIFGLFLPHVKK